MASSHSVVGKRITRFDAIDKVTGKAKYGIDLKVDGMLYGKILRSPYPHARIKKIDTTKAENHPKVRAVATLNEVPKVVGTIGKLMTKEGRESLYLQDDVVRFIGDPIAAVAAEDEESAQDALSLIDVEYEELPAVFDPIEALKEDSPNIYGDSNILFHLEEKVGDIDKGFQEADQVFEGKYYTSKQKHATIEPMSSCVADYGRNGKLTVYSSTQRPHVSKLYLAGAFGIPADKVRIIKPYTGGAFGGRDYLIHGLEIMCSILSKKTDKPVKISFTRGEDFEGTEARHPFIIDLQMGVNRDGMLTASKMNVVMDVGGYGPHAAGVLIYAMRQGIALYKCPNITFVGDSVCTNTSLCGAYRGYGNTEINWALESLMDEIAEKLGIDPVELRRMNYRNLGEVDPVTGATIESDGMKECLDKGAESIGWKDREKIESAKGTKRRGMGMACLTHGSGGRFDIPDAGSATVQFNSDGSVNLITAAADDGQGNKTVLAQIAAEELGIGIDQISVSDTDTDLTPWDSGTHGSRMTYAGGLIVKQAAANAKKALFDVAADYINIDRENMDVKEGVLYDVKDPSMKITIKDLLTGLLFEDLATGKQVMGFHSGVVPGSPQMFGANFVEVEVDTDTGAVEVKRIAAAFDVGKAINPSHVEGQVTGGEVMGIGYALTEGMVTRKGRILNPNFADYRMLRACDAPPIDGIIVESNEPSGPFGAKAAGEATNGCIAPAIANAIHDAVGVRVKDLPITQEKILNGLRLAAQK